MLGFLYLSCTHVSERRSMAEGVLVRWTNIEYLPRTVLRSLFISIFFINFISFFSLKRLKRDCWSRYMQAKPANRFPIHVCARLTWNTPRILSESLHISFVCKFARLGRAFRTRRTRCSCLRRFFPTVACCCVRKQSAKENCIGLMTSPQPFGPSPNWIILHSLRRSRELRLPSKN